MNYEQMEPRQPTVVQSAYVDAVSLEHLLSMAHRYRSEGNLRQATEMYWMLWDEHGNEVQATRAKTSLLELAEAYDHSGSRHMARAIYERLL